MERVNKMSSYYRDLAVNRDILLFVSRLPKNLRLQIMPKPNAAGGKPKAPVTQLT